MQRTISSMGLHTLIPARTSVCRFRFRMRFRNSKSKQALCQAKQVNLPSSIANNNVLLPGLINPVALKVASLLPVSTDPCGRITYGVPSNSNEYQSVTKIDSQRNPKDQIFARYFITDYTLQSYYDMKNLLTAGTPGLQDRVQSVTLGDTYLVSANTVN